MPVTIQVDTAALHRLGQQLAGVVQDLDLTASDDFAARVGDPYLERALASVQHDWSKKRKVICGYLDAVGKAAIAAAAAYEQTEHAISGAVR